MNPKYEDMASIDNISAELAYKFSVLYDKIVALEIQNEQLTKERDEARRDICDMHHITGFLSGDYAYSRGWDCFKCGYPEFSDETVKYRDFWNTYIAKLTAERDEARRMYCGFAEYNERGSENSSKEEIARALGWDCYKEDGK